MRVVASPGSTSTASSSTSPISRCKPRPAASRCCARSANSVGGIDVEGALRPAGLTVKANIGWSDARYRDYLTVIDGTATQLAGNHQVLTPSVRVGAGLLYAPSALARIAHIQLDRRTLAEQPQYFRGTGLRCRRCVVGLPLRTFHCGHPGVQPWQSARRRAAQRAWRRTVLSTACPPWMRR